MWWWCLDNAQDGELGHIDAEDIADGAYWEGPPVALIEGLVFAGFLDKDGDDLRVHHWEDYAGKLIEKRKSDAERKRRSRHTQDIQAPSVPVHRTSSGHPRDGAGTYLPTYQEEEYMLKTAEPFMSEPAVKATGHDGQDTYGQPEPFPEREASDMQEVPDLLLAPDKPVRAKTQPRHYDLPGFGRFWAACPKKRDKDVALAEWDKLRPDADLQAVILADITAKIPTDDWQREGGQFIPYPCRYLKNHRWEDELMPVPAPSAPVNVRLYSPANDPKYSQRSAA